MNNDQNINYKAENNTPPFAMQIDTMIDEMRAEINRNEMKRRLFAIFRRERRNIERIEEAKIIQEALRNFKINKIDSYPTIN